MFFCIINTHPVVLIHTHKHEHSYIPFLFLLLPSYISAFGVQLEYKWNKNLLSLLMIISTYFNREGATAVTHVGRGAEPVFGWHCLLCLVLTLPYLLKLRISRTDG